MFAIPEHLKSYGDDVLRQLAEQRHLKDLETAKFTQRLGHYYGELNALHPFREGNGRTQRAFLSQLTVEAAHTLDWSRRKAHHNSTASRDSLRVDDTARDCSNSSSIPRTANMNAATAAGWGARRHRVRSAHPALTPLPTHCELKPTSSPAAPAGSNGRPLPRPDRRAFPNRPRQSRC